MRAALPHWYLPVTRGARNDNATINFYIHVASKANSSLSLFPFCNVNVRRIRTYRETRNRVIKSSRSQLIGLPCSRMLVRRRYRDLKSRFVLVDNVLFFGGGGGWLISGRRDVIIKTYRYLLTLLNDRTFLVTLSVQLRLNSLRNIIRELNIIYYPRIFLR